MTKNPAVKKSKHRRPPSHTAADIIPWTKMCSQNLIYSFLL
jgi:hypothetical protein